MDQTMNDTLVLQFAVVRTGWQSPIYKTLTRTIHSRIKLAGHI